MIHRDSDEFSRLVLFLGASNNNRQDSVLKIYFVNGGVTYNMYHPGLECRKRQWTQCNLLVDASASKIRAQFFHQRLQHINKRIERLRQDLWNGTTNITLQVVLFHE